MKQTHKIILQNKLVVSTEVSILKDKIALTVISSGQHRQYDNINKGLFAESFTNSL